MSTTLALVILSWVAIVVLYLGLASVQREVRQLRRQLAADRVKGIGEAGGGTSLGDVRLPAGFASRVARPGADRVVLVADSTCPLCQHAAGTLAAAATDESRPVLLTYEPAESWPDLPDAVELVQDREAWSALAHLSPPVLLTVAPSGEIASLELPTTEAEVARTLAVPSLSTAGGKP